MILNLCFLLIILSFFTCAAASIATVIDMLVPWFYMLADVLGKTRFTYIESHFKPVMTYSYYLVLLLIMLYWLRRKSKFINKNMSNYQFDK
jgi:O-antigen/teichoic acid export membrane protein